MTPRIQWDFTPGKSFTLPPLLQPKTELVEPTSHFSIIPLKNPYAEILRIKLPLISVPRPLPSLLKSPDFLDVKLPLVERNFHVLRRSCLTSNSTHYLSSHYTQAKFTYTSTIPLNQKQVLPNQLVVPHVTQRNIQRSNSRSSVESNSNHEKEPSADNQSTRKADCNFIKTVSEIRKGLCAVSATVCASKH